VANVKTTAEAVRTPIDGSELVRLATAGANWQASLTAIGPSAWVNVRSFGALGNGVADDTVAIQAAIDFAYAHQRQVIYMPAGSYKISSTIWVDPPGNMRVSGIANPTIFAFSMHLMGEPGGANNEGFGTIIKPTFNNNIAIVLGSGRSMMASYFSVQGPTGDFYLGYRGAQSAAGVGLLVSAQCSRSLTTCVEVMNFYTGFQTGVNGNINLADSNTWIKCLVTNAHQCWYFSQIENFINTLYDCQAGGTISIYNPVSNNVNVVGGNMSASDSRFSFLDMSGVSAISGSAGPGDIPYIDVSLTTADMPTHDSLYNFSLGIFNVFAILTTNFGVIPFTLTSSSITSTDGIYPATMTARLSTLANWRNFAFGGDNSILPANCDLEAELQAATKLYCAEMVTPFFGPNIHAQGCHVENPDAVTCFVNSATAWAPGRKTTVKNCMLNWEPSISGFNTPGTPRNYAGFLCQQAHPFVVIGQGSVLITDCIAQNSLALPYDWQQNSSDFIMERCHLPPPNTRMNSRSGIFITGDEYYNTNQVAAGGGEFDSCYTPASGSGLFSDLGRGTLTPQSYWGYRPVAYTRPILKPEFLAALQGTLPAIDWAHPGSNMISYNLLWGGQAYDIYTGFNAAKPFYGVVSDHNGWTIGQDLTYGGMAVTYKGKSNCVYMDTTSMLMMFPGLIIILSDGTSDRSYMVNGLYSALGYVTVSLAESPVSGGALQGVKTTVYTATTIKQQLFALRFLDVVASVNYQTPATGFSITLGNNDSELVLNPAGTLATGTITMCPAPYDTMKVTFRSTQTISTLTVLPNAGQSIAVAPVTLLVNVEKTAVYRKANTTWFFG
jgi:hypothetical protein